MHSCIHVSSYPCIHVSPLLNVWHTCWMSKRCWLMCHPMQSKRWPTGNLVAATSPPITYVTTFTAKKLQCFPPSVPPEGWWHPPISYVLWSCLFSHSLPFAFLFWCFCFSDPSWVVATLNKLFIPPWPLLRGPVQDHSSYKEQQPLVICSSGSLSGGYLPQGFHQMHQNNWVWQIVSHQFTQQHLTAAISQDRQSSVDGFGKQSRMSSLPRIIALDII